MRTNPADKNGNGTTPTLTECVRRMLISHADADNETFIKAAEEYAFEERRRNHHAVAKDFEQILNDTLRSHPKRLFPVPNGNGASPEIPRDRERGLALIELREPQRRFEQLTLDGPTQATLEIAIAENRQDEILRARGLRPSNKLLFCGPPGCGKTVTAEALATELYLPFAIVRFESVVSSYLGETSANLAKVFEFARSRPMVVLFDEFDAIGRSRNDESEHGELKRVVNALLQLIDRFRGETILIAATNHQGTLDSAIWRRFDEILNFPRPTKPQIVEMLIRCLRQFGVAQNVNLPRFAARLLGMSHGDIEHIALDAVKQAVLANEDQVSLERLTTAADRQVSRLQTEGAVATKVRRPPKRRRG